MKNDSDTIRMFFIYAVAGLLISLIFTINVLYDPMQKLLRLSDRVNHIETRFDEILGDLSKGQREERVTR